MPRPRKSPWNQRQHLELDESDPVSVLAARAERMFQPQIDQLFERLRQAVDRAGERIERLPDELLRAQQRQAQQAAEAARRRAEQRTPPQPPPRSELSEAYAILGFQEGKRLTVAEIKARHRALAKIFHPDRSGSAEAMKRLNLATESLLKTCRG